MTSVELEEQVRSLVDLPKVSPTILKSCLNKGEQGDVDLLSHLYCDKLAYDHSDSTWYFFDGIAGWRKDRITGIIRTVSEGIAGAYEGLEDDEAQKRAKSLRGYTRIKNVLSLARADPVFALTGDEWHHNHWFLPVENGVINLQDGSFNTAQPKDYLRIVSPARWKGLEEPAPRFIQFLEEIFGGDHELIGFTQQVFGYAITGQATEQKIIFLSGEGRNGKDTLLTALANVLGDFVGPVGSDVLVDNKRSPGAPQPHIVNMRHLRVAWVNETNEGAKLNEGQVKMLTGGGMITARTLYGQPITFRPHYTLFLMTNRLPMADAYDYALWERIVCIPFTQAFVDHPVAPNEHPRDQYLMDKLKTESSGILAWLVRGAIQWQKDGLSIPQSVIDSTESYKKEQDSLTIFLEEVYNLGEGRERARNAYLRYLDWCKENGVDERSRLGIREFGRRMQKRFCLKRDESGRYYEGLSAK